MGPPGAGILPVGLGPRVSIPESITINLKGSLEVAQGMMCSAGFLPLKTNGEFSTMSGIYKTTSEVRNGVGGKLQGAVTEI